MTESEIIIIVTAFASMVVVAVFAIWKGTSPVDALTDALYAMMDNNALLDSLENQIDRMDVVTASRLETLVNVLDPITDLTPTQIDDDLADWLREIADGSKKEDKG